MSALTNRLKLSIFSIGDEVNWGDLVTHWANMMDSVLAQLLVRNYVESGLGNTGTSGLVFSYASGDVNILGTSYSLSSGGPTLSDDTKNWIFVRSNSVVVSTTPPSGNIDYCLLYCVTTTSGSISSIADLRYGFPIVNGITISPENVNPSGNINIATSKRIYHTDALVGSNTIMLAAKQNLASWTNLSVAKAWTELDASAFVAANAKFAIVGLYCSLTTLALAPMWANLRCRTDSGQTDANRYTAIDYGHPGAENIDGDVRGQAHVFMIPFATGSKLDASVTIPSIGISPGAFFAYVDLLGYIE